MQSPSLGMFIRLEMSGREGPGNGRLQQQPHGQRYRCWQGADHNNSDE